MGASIGADSAMWASVRLDGALGASIGVESAMWASVNTFPVREQEYDSAMWAPIDTGADVSTSEEVYTHAGAQRAIRRAQRWEPIPLYISNWLGRRLCGIE